MTAQPPAFAEEFERAVQAARTGDKRLARTLFRELTEAVDTNELAWMWRASLAEEPGEAAAHLRRALGLNPGNRRARAWLARCPGADRSGPAHLCPFCKAFPGGARRCPRCRAVTALAAWEEADLAIQADAGAVEPAILDSDPARGALACLNLGRISQALIRLSECPDCRALPIVETLRSRPEVWLAVPEAIAATVEAIIDSAGYRATRIGDTLPGGVPRATIVARTVGRLRAPRVFWLYNRLTPWTRLRAGLAGAQACDLTSLPRALASSR